MSSRKPKAVEDDKLTVADSSRPKERNVYGGKRFGAYQCFCYFWSALALVCYFLHFLITGASGYSDRVIYDSYAELIILLIRMSNELYFNKLDIPTFVHHLIHFSGMYLGINVPFSETFGQSLWLLCHMQILHFPMFLWYYGCRINCVSNSKTICSFCKYFFPYTYMLSCGYRVCIMMCTSYTEYRASHLSVAVTFAVFSVILVRLDYEWMFYFLGKTHGCLNWPLKTSTMFFLVAIGILVGFIVCFHL